MNRLLVFKRAPIVILSMAIVSIDQLSKSFVTSFMKEGDSILLIPNLLQLNLVRNYGAAFSLLKNQSMFLAFMSLIVSVLIIIYLALKPTFTKLQGLGLAFLLGGTLGNGLDRWILGYVNDFLELIVIQFPVFNFADLSINIGVICIILNNLSNPNSHS